MEKLVESLGITRLSKSQVSTMAQELDAQVAGFRTRPLDQGPYTFVAADALVLKVREGGRGRSRRERAQAPHPRWRDHHRRPGSTPALVDAPFLGVGHTIWLPVPQMDRVALFNGGQEQTQWPVQLFRHHLGARR